MGQTELSSRQEGQLQCIPIFIVSSVCEIYYRRFVFTPNDVTDPIGHSRHHEWGIHETEGLFAMIQQI